MSKQTDALERYARSVRETLRAGPTNVEQALAPSFKNLIDDLLPLVPAGAKIIRFRNTASRNLAAPTLV